MRDDVPTSAGIAGDIKGGTPGDWLAIGWFTLDYRPLAEKLAANLTEHAIPHHLWARPKLTKGWNTLQKPSVALEAMDTYPGKTLVLMDVDCIVRGDIAPVTEIAGDVGFSVKARQMRGSRTRRKRAVVTCSSRVVVLRPTEGARAFAQEWERLCGRARDGGDEVHMVWAYLQRPDISYAKLDQRYAGNEISGNVANAVIVHDGIHDREERPWWSLRGAIQELERRLFRTGRTKRIAYAGR